jgi:predicted transcriptional regulator of viral defense system
MGSEPLPPDRQVAELAGRQHGIAARRQLLAVGLTPRMVDRRVAAGRLHVVHRGVYAVGHAILIAKGRWLAAVLSCGPGALLSHRSAACLWGIRLAANAKIDVTVIRGGSHARFGVTIHHARGLTDLDRTLISAIPVTDLPRTLLDLADVVSPHQLELAVEVAERRRLLDMRAIEELLERSNGRRGVRRLRSALSLPTGAIDTRSPLERRFLAFCGKHDLPRPQVNVVVAGYEVDAHWPAAKLVAELDSVTYHHTRAAFERDRAKDIQLQLDGQRVIRVTDRRIESDGVRLAAEIATLLAAQ